MVELSVVNLAGCWVDLRVVPTVEQMAGKKAAQRAVQMVACLAEKMAENSADLKVGPKVAWSVVSSVETTAVGKVVH